MFNNRKNPHKPNPELIQRFQQHFSDVVLPTTHAAPNQIPAQPITPRLSGSLQASDGAPQAQQDLRYSEFIDPNSLAFVSQVNQPHGYYTPGSGGLAAMFHSQAGDLHTPGMGLHMMTPLSLPQQIAGTTANADGSGLSMDQYNSSFIPQAYQIAQQPPFAAGPFVQDSGYDAMEDQVDGLSLNDMDMQGTAQTVAPTLQHLNQMDDHSLGEKFRFHVTLRAPTAMVKDRNEIPVSYLNKGQAYSISVVDTAPPPISHQPVKYRTYIRVSFQDKEQRSKPAACWQLWKEGRGSNEAHQRGGKLQAVEYVDPIQGGIEDLKSRPIQLESSSFDGFCVTWTPNPTTGMPDCAISVRFNFLSTDFSHSKGVKGIPVRLCAKTEMISPDDQAGPNGADAEVCYCKVKLFRDHGAERKLSNDVAHVKKTIEKLNQQIAQAEMGAGNYGKRKRSSGSIGLKNSDPRPSKITKHKRTWSMGSQDAPEKMSMEDDLRVKLALMNEMFGSTRTVSILGLRGEEEDDPDLYPVTLPDPHSFVKKEVGQFGIETKAGLQTLSPTSSSMSLNSPAQVSSSLQQPGLFYDSGYQASLSDNSRHCSEFNGDRGLLKHPVKVQRLSSGDMPQGFIEAVGIDPTYRPPEERPAKPIACFYVRFPRGDPVQDDYYRAVYLTERTVGDLMRQISMKQRIDPNRIVRVLHVKKDNGIKIMVDDDVVRELPDGQDMVVEIAEASAFDDAISPTEKGTTPAVEVKLSY